MTWDERNKAMMKNMGWSLHTIAAITGFTYDSVKSQVRRKFPPWLKVAIVVFETLKQHDNENK